MKKTDRQTDLTQVVVEAISQGLASNFQDTFLSIWSIFVKHLSPKGQKKPKADWRAVDSLKKRTNKFVFIAFLLYTANKTNSFVHFLGESTARRNCFRFIWPLFFTKTKSRISQRPPVEGKRWRGNAVSVSLGNSIKRIWRIPVEKAQISFHMTELTQILAFALK